MENLDHTSKGKTVAIVSYLTLVGALIALFMHQDNKTKFGAFHLRQAIGLIILQFAMAMVIGWFDSFMISSAFWVFIVVLWVYGSIGAIQGKYQEIPILGPLFQEWFSGIVKDN